MTGQKSLRKVLFFFFFFLLDLKMHGKMEYLQFPRFSSRARRKASLARRDIRAVKAEGVFQACLPCG